MEGVLVWLAGLIVTCGGAWPVEQQGDLELVKMSNSLMVDCGHHTREIKVSTNQSLAYELSSRYLLIDEVLPKNCRIHWRFDIKQDAHDYSTYSLYVEGEVKMLEYKKSLRDDEDSNLARKSSNDDSCNGLSTLTITDADDSSDTGGTTNTYCDVSKRINYHTMQEDVNFYLTTNSEGVYGFGFDLKIRVLHICGGPMGETAVLKSPGFPNNYLPSSLCYWVFQTGTSGSFKITCDTFDLQPARRNRCIDHIKIFSRGFKAYCGDSLHGKTIKFDTPTLIMEFVADKSNNKKFQGFQCTVKPIKLPIKS